MLTIGQNGNSNRTSVGKASQDDVQAPSKRTRACALVRLLYDQDVTRTRLQAHGQIHLQAPKAHAHFHADPSTIVQAAKRTFSLVPDPQVAGSTKEPDTRSRLQALGQQFHEHKKQTFSQALTKRTSSKRPSAHSHRCLIHRLQVQPGNRTHTHAAASVRAANPQTQEAFIRTSVDQAYIEQAAKRTFTQVPVLVMQVPQGQRHTLTRLQAFGQQS